MKLCDLHTHSIFSDGTYTPTQIIDMAIEMGLSAVALSDHDNVDGLPEFLAAAKGKNIKAVAGAEFSVDYNGTELHVLGLFIPEAAFGRITELMEGEVRRKEQSNRDLIASLQRAGYDVDFDTIRSRTPNGKFNRAQIADELMRKNYAGSIREAMETILLKFVGDKKTRQRMTPFEMIDVIKSVGAVPVLAHPLKDLSVDELRVFLPIAKERGLVGMECYYSEYDEETTNIALSLADEFGLKYSGGSDYHGHRKPHIQLGTGCGGLKIPYEWAEELETYKKAE